MPPRVLRVRMCSRTAISGPPGPARPEDGSSGSSSGCGATTRINLSPRNFRAAVTATTCGSLPSPLRTCWSRASISCWSASASIRCAPASWFIMRGQLGHGRGAQEVGADVLEGAHLRCRTRSDPADQQPQVLAGEVGVLLRAGQRELGADGGLIQDEPRVVVPARGDVPQRAERVETGEQRRRESVAAGVQPERGRSRQDPDAVMVPHRRVVDDPLRVVPHPVPVDDSRAGPLGRHQHRSVDVVGHAGDHRRRRVAAGEGPVGPDKVEVATDPAAGDDHSLGREAERADLGAWARCATRSLGGRENRA